MFEHVKDLGSKPRSAYAKRKKTDLIILHHFATDASAKAVHLYHKAIGHKGMTTTSNSALARCMGAN